MTARRCALAAVLLALAAGRGAAQAGPESVRQADPEEAEPAPAGPGSRRAASVTLEVPPGEDQAAASLLLAVTPGSPITSRGLRRTALRLFQGGRSRDQELLHRESLHETGSWPALG